MTTSLRPAINTALFYALPATVYSTIKTHMINAETALEAHYEEMV